jgi:hypothetical protein
MTKKKKKKKESAREGEIDGGESGGRTEMYGRTASMTVKPGSGNTLNAEIK